MGVLVRSSFMMKMLLQSTEMKLQIILDFLLQMYYIRIAKVKVGNENDYSN